MGRGSRETEQLTRALMVGRSELRITRWRREGPAVEPDSGYGRCYWLPIIGPTSYLLAQTLSAMLANAPEASDFFYVATGPLAEALGISTGTGAHAPLVRCVTRLVVFELAVPLNGVLGVPQRWPLLTHGQHRRLPAWLASSHRDDLARETTPRRIA